MPITQFVVDAFTDRPFAGNPAAVVITDGPLDAVGMQALAAENNIAETAYLHPIDGGWSLRWMTPTVEVDLCGHATLASAHVLFTERGEDAEELRFSTRSGWLTARRRADGTIALDLPTDPPSAHEPLPGLVDALGIEPVSVLRGRDIWLLEVASATDVLSADPTTARCASSRCTGRSSPPPPRVTRGRTVRPSTSCRGSSPPAPASTKTP